MYYVSMLIRRFVSLRVKSVSHDGTLHRQREVIQTDEYIC